MYKKGLDEEWSKLRMRITIHYDQSMPLDIEEVQRSIFKIKK